MNGTKKVVLSLTRSKSEVQTSQQMIAAEIPHLNSFGQVRTVKPTEGPDLDTILSQPANPQPVKKPIKSVIGRCSYCGTPDSTLMDIPNFKICKSCIQIELGKSRSQSDQQVTAEADKVRGE
jgi:ribosomal protein S14